MRMTFIKGAGRVDVLEIARADGSVERVPQPKQRIVPHDMVHVAVEERLAGGFLSMVADGGGAAFGAGTASMAAEPVERLVEVLQADAWSAPLDADALVEVYAQTCAARGHAALPITAALVDAVRDRLIELQIAWDAVPVGGTLVIARQRPQAGTGSGPL